MNEIYNKAFCNVRLRKREAFYFCLFVGEYLFCFCGLLAVGILRPDPNQPFYKRGTGLQRKETLVTDLMISTWQDALERVQHSVPFPLDPRGERLQCTHLA